MVSRTPIAFNWTTEINGKALQKCYRCAHKENPELYEDKRHHGTGGTYMDDDKIKVGSLITIAIGLGIEE